MTIIGGASPAKQEKIVKVSDEGTLTQSDGGTLTLKLLSLYIGILTRKIR